MLIVMKTGILKVAVVAIFLLFGSAAEKSSAQLSDMGLILAGGISDAEKIGAAYFSPYTEAFGANLNAGWYNTANTHRLLGFDLTFSLNLAVVPGNAKTFDLNEIEGLTGSFTGNGIAPTIANRMDNRPEMQYFENTLSYELPNGTGLGYIPAPTLHLGVGLPKDTDLIIRYVPDIKVGRSGNMGLWGIGIKHSLKQWIPVLRRMPVLNLSLMGGYTSFTNSAGMSFVPSDIGADDNTTAAVSFDGQKLEFGMNSYTANLIVSADIPFITFYGGAGFNSGSSTLKMLGYYPIPELDGSDLVVNDNSVQQKDPLNIKMNNGDSKLQPRFNAGLKFKLAVIHIHFDYIYSDYSVGSVGLGINFR